MSPGVHSSLFLVREPQFPEFFSKTCFWSAHHPEYSSISGQANKHVGCSPGQNKAGRNGKEHEFYSKTDLVLIPPLTLSNPGLLLLLSHLNRVQLCATP